MNLDRKFRDWLKEVGSKRGYSVEDVACQIGLEEIRNRFSLYPLIKREIEQDPIKWDTVFGLLRKCWALYGRFDATHLNEFARHGGEAIAAVLDLLREISKSKGKAVDKFIQTATKLGYENRSRHSADRPGAALLASVLLTCSNPSRFVDYRRFRWENFANALGYPLPVSPLSEGDRFIWASEFARKIVDTDTYKDMWGNDTELWTLAGICWDARNPQLPLPDPPDPSEEQAYPEGAARRRLHLIRERNASIVRRAKELRKSRDPGLHCETCRFSYREYYGERGKGFIEAHHKIPLAKLRPDTRTRVEDLALLCANCHRMIHQNPSLTIEKLKNTLEELRKIVS